MSLHRKKWSKKDKEEVLLYNDQHGVSQTSREFKSYFRNIVAAFSK